MVSSTVPRLEDRCPPVWLTECSTKVRSSSASCLSWRRSSLRRSAGSLMVFSNSYMGLGWIEAWAWLSSLPARNSSPGKSPPPGKSAVPSALLMRREGAARPGWLRFDGSSKFPVNDEVRELGQARSPAAKRRQGIHGPAAQLAGEFLGAADAHDAHVSRLVLRRVLAGGLAQAGGGRLVVEDVVHHLEGEADGPGVAVKALQFRGDVVRRTAMRPQHHRRADQ